MFCNNLMVLNLKFSKFIIIICMCTYICMIGIDCISTNADANLMLKLLLIPY